MKIIFTSFPFLSSNIPGEKSLSWTNRKLNLLPGKNFLPAALSLFFLTFFVSNLIAQSGADVAIYPISTSDYTHDVWKSKADYSNVVTSEQAIAAQKLADPQLPAYEFPLYTGYARMLSYMQADINGNLPLEDIAKNSYKRIEAESSTDPELTSLKMESFKGLYLTLLDKLHY